MKNQKLFIILLISISAGILLFGSKQVSAQKNKKQSEPGSFTSLSDAVNADPLTVIKLDLTKKKLREFPQEVLKFKNLQQLNLSNNKLKSIPENISDLQHLTYLDISKNSITSLPQNIGKFNKLNSFKMSQNKISELPQSFFYLTSLEIIDFYSNPLSFEPTLFKKISKNIKFIDVRNTALNEEECKMLQKVLPDAKIKFDKGCNCQ
jgi:Leucine-rich repeat (LRR) protein